MNEHRPVGKPRQDPVYSKLFALQCLLLGVVACLSLPYVAAVVLWPLLRYVGSSWWPDPAGTISRWWWYCTVLSVLFGVAVAIWSRWKSKPDYFPYEDAAAFKARMKGAWGLGIVSFMALVIRLSFSVTDWFVPLLFPAVIVLVCQRGRVHAFMDSDALNKAQALWMEAQNALARERNAGLVQFTDKLKETNYRFAQATTVGELLGQYVSFCGERGIYASSGSDFRRALEDITSRVMDEFKRHFPGDRQVAEEHYGQYRRWCKENCTIEASFQQFQAWLHPRPVPSLDYLKIDRKIDRLREERAAEQEKIAKQPPKRDRIQERIDREHAAKWWTRWSEGGPPS